MNPEHTEEVHEEITEEEMISDLRNYLTPEKLEAFDAAVLAGEPYTKLAEGFAEEAKKQREAATTHGVIATSLGAVSIGGFATGNPVVGLPAGVGAVVYGAEKIGNERQAEKLEDRSDAALEQAHGPSRTIAEEGLRDAGYLPKEDEDTKKEA